MPSVSPAQHRLMEALASIDRAYLAGLFDGEGTVAIYESWAPLKDGGRRPIWIYQVQIANTCLRVLDHVRRLCGGAVVRKSRGKAHWRQGHVWRLCGEDAAVFMATIRPYSIVKAEEMDEAIQFRALCLPRGRRQTDAEIEVKRGVVVRLKEMKRAI
jgi:hypothetical protein